MFNESAKDELYDESLMRSVWYTLVFKQFLARSFTSSPSIDEDVVFKKFLIRSLRSSPYHISIFTKYSFQGILSEIARIFIIYRMNSKWKHTYTSSVHENSLVSLRKLRLKAFWLWVFFNDMNHIY